MHAQSPGGFSSARALSATAHWRTPLADLSLQSPEGSCRDTLFAQPRATTPSANARWAFAIWQTPDQFSPVS